MKDDDKPLDPELEAYIALLLAGGLYTPEGVDIDPECQLHGWQVMEVSGSWGKSHHFVGVHNDGRTGRVSSPIQSFDPAQKIGVTRSGRIYKLMGEPGGDGLYSEREYVRRAWLRRNGLGDVGYTDVTAAYRNRIAKADR